MLLLACVAAGLTAAAASPVATRPSPASAGPDAPAEVPSGATIAGRVSVSPIVVHLEGVPQKPKSKGQAEVRATVTNLSAARVTEVVLTLRSSSSSLITKPDGVQGIRNLGAGKSAAVTWTLCSPAGGTFDLVVIAVPVSSGNPVESEPVSVALPAGRC